MAITEQKLKQLIGKGHLVSAEDLQKAVTTARHLGCSITDVLIGRDLLTDEDLGKILSQYYKVKFIDLKKTPIAQAALGSISESFASERVVIVFARTNSVVSLALEDPRDLELTELVARFYREVQEAGGNRWDTSGLLTRLTDVG